MIDSLLALLGFTLINAVTPDDFTYWEREFE